ncbi:MAG: CoA transferase, partial [Pseudomonadota bacterium]
EWPAMHKLLEETFASKTRDEWAGLFEGTDACVAPVLDFDEAATYSHNAERKIFFEANSVVQTTVVPRLGRSTSPTPLFGSRTGADGRKVLEGAGFKPVKIESLATSGVLL